MVGGFSDIKEANDETKAVFADIKGALAEALGKAVESAELVSYKTQVVAGVNYVALFLVNGTEHATVHAFKPLPHTGEALQVKKVEAGNTLA